MKQTFYYSVANCGDGSVSVNFFDSKELADWDEEHMAEGWGEPCVGSVSVDAENADSIKLLEVVNALSYYLNMRDEHDYVEEQEDIGAFVERFFPDGLPEFIVDIYDENYYCVTVESDPGNILFKRFAWNSETKKAMTTERGRKEYEVELNQGRN